MQINWFINNQPVDPPMNWPEVRIVLHFDEAIEGDAIQASINIENVEWVLANSTILRNHIDAGVTGNGVGIYEPPTVRAELVKAGTIVQVFNGLIDLPRAPKLIDKNRILTNLIERGDEVRFTDRARARSFAYMYSIGEITDADFVDIDYVLSSIPDYTQTAVVSLAIFGIVKEIKEQVERVVSIVAEAVGISAAGATGGIGAILLVVAKLIIITIYFIAMTIALVQLTKDLINSLISPVRQYKGMRLLTLMQKGADHLGLAFDSTAFDADGWGDLVILPEKDKRPDKLINEKGYPTNRGQMYTYFDALQVFKKLINGRHKADDTTLKVEKRDFFDSLSTYILPDALLNEKSYNADEIQANLNIEFAIDEQDRNTVDQYSENKTNFHRVTQPTNIGNKRKVQIKGLQQVAVPLALPTRKEGLTDIEKAVLAMAKLADGLATVFNLFTGKGPSKLADLIEDRKGMMLLNGDIVGVAKIIPTDGGSKIRPDYRSIMNAEILHDLYYDIESFAVAPTNNRQEAIHDGLDIPFCFEDYLKVINNNNFTTFDGRAGRFTRLEGTPEGRVASADVRIKEIFTNNLEDVIV